MQLPFSVLLCATDFSEAGNAAVEVAYGLAAPGATVHLLHFPEPQILPSTPAARPGGAGAPPQTETERRAAERLRRLPPAWAAPKEIRTETHVIDGPDDPVALIEREGARLHAQVVILGSHGSKGWKGLLTGSVATGALRRCTLPVILVHPPKR